MTGLLVLLLLARAQAAPSGEAGASLAVDALPVEPGSVNAVPNRSVPPAVSPPGPPSLPQPQLLRLASGTPVWLVERHDVELVRVELSLAGGWLASDDPAHLQFAGTLLEQGTADQDAREWSDALADIGARVSLGVGATRVWADVEAVSGTEAKALGLARAGLLHPGPDRAEVRRQRRSWVLDRKSEINSPGAVHTKAVARQLYPADHPLGNWPTVRELRALEGDRALAVLDVAVRLGRPSIVVVGDTTPEAILPLLEEAWGDLAGTMTVPDLAAPPVRGPRLVVVDYPGATQTRITATLPAPGAWTEGQLMADTCNAILGGDFTSRLNQNLREDKGYAYGAFSDLRLWKGHGRLTIEVTVPLEHGAAALEQLRLELAGMYKRPPGAEELDRVRSLRFVREATELVDPVDLAFDLGLLSVYDLAPGWDAEELARLQRATPAQVALACRAIFDTDDVLWVVTGDREVVELQLEAAGIFPDAYTSAQAALGSRRAGVAR